MFEMGAQQAGDEKEEIKEEIKEEAKELSSEQLTAVARKAAASINNLIEGVRQLNNEERQILIQQKIENLRNLARDKHKTAYPIMFSLDPAESKKESKEAVNNTINKIMKKVQEDTAKFLDKRKHFFQASFNREELSAAYNYEDFQRIAPTEEEQITLIKLYGKYFSSHDAKTLYVSVKY